MFRAYEHEPSARVTDLAASNERPNVSGLGMFAALFQAVADGLETRFLAALTAIDALLQAWVDVVWHSTVLR